MEQMWNNPNLGNLYNSEQSLSDERHEMDDMTEDENIIAEALQIQADIKRMQANIERKRAENEITKQQIAEMRKNTAHELEISEHLRARLQAVEMANEARQEIIEKEKQACQYLFEQKHAVKRKTEALKKHMEEMTEKWSKMTEDLAKRADEYEKMYLSMPWAANYKRLYDEDKNLTDDIAVLRGQYEEKQKEIASLENEIANSDPARSWNKACVHFASDMLHARRLAATYEQLKAQLDEIKKRRMQECIDKELLVPSTPALAQPPPRTPQTVPQARQTATANFNTPAPNIGLSRSSKTPVVSQRAAPSPMAHNQPSPIFKTPVAAPGSAKKQFKQPRLEPPPPPSPPPPRSESPLANDFFNFGGCDGFSQDSDDNYSDSNGGFSNFQLNFGDDDGDDMEEDTPFNFMLFE